MKKWVKYIRAAILLFTVLFPLTALAEDTGEIKLKKDGSRKAVLSLTVEDKIAQDMTSLRLQMYVDVKSGEIAPFKKGKGTKSKFVFSDEIKSQVKSWETFKRDDGYVIDIIISGTESIFGEDNEAAPAVEAAAERVEKTVTIGTLTLAAAEETGPFSAKVGMLTEESTQVSEDSDTAASGVPAVEYMEKNGLQSLKLYITNTNTKTLKGKGTGTQETESEKQTETEPPTETEPETQPNTGDSGDDTKPDETEKPPEETRPFNKEEDPQLKLSCPLAGTSYVHFTWKEIEGADGYEIRKIKNNGKAKLIATIMAGEGTEFERVFDYNKTLSFEVRAFQIKTNGKKKCGKYGAVQMIKTPVKTVDRPTAVAATVPLVSKKVTITWQNPANADGIRIFMKKGKNGQYETIRTIDGTDITTYTLTVNLSQSYTFRISGYKYVSGKPALFSNYSDEASVTTNPPTITKVALSLTKKGWPQFTWKKLDRVSGYQVYRGEAQTGPFVRLLTIDKRKKVKYTDKSVQKGKTYYYRVRAYVQKPDGGYVYGYSSSPVAITVK